MSEVAPHAGQQGCRSGSPQRTGGRGGTRRGQEVGQPKPERPAGNGEHAKTAMFRPRTAGVEWNTRMLHAAIARMPSMPTSRPGCSRAPAFTAQVWEVAARPAIGQTGDFFSPVLDCPMVRLTAPPATSSSDRTIAGVNSSLDLAEASERIASKVADASTPTPAPSISTTNRPTRRARATYGTRFDDPPTARARTGRGDHRNRGRRGAPIMTARDAHLDPASSAPQFSRGRVRVDPRRAGSGRDRRRAPNVRTRPPRKSGDDELRC